jgi:protein phosphatase
LLKDTNPLMTGSLRCYYFTNNGSLRNENEDSLLISDLIISNTSMKSQNSMNFKDINTIFCVADGMGGAAGGEIAGNIILNCIRNNWTKIQTPDELKGLLFDSKRKLNRIIEKKPELLGLGATIAGIIIKNNQLLVFNSGDCRVYRLNGFYFQKVTHDHSLVQILVDTDSINEDEMRSHEQKHIVTSAIIGDGTPENPDVNTYVLDLRKQDTFFICSDGLWETIPLDVIEELYQIEGFKGFSIKVLEKCHEFGSKDNISFIAISYSLNEDSDDR